MSRRNRSGTPHRDEVCALRQRTGASGSRHYANDNPYKLVDPDGREGAAVTAFVTGGCSHCLGNGPPPEGTGLVLAAAAATVAVGILAPEAVPALIGAVLRNPTAANSLGTAVAEAAAGEALGGASLAAGAALTAAQTKNVARFESKLPTGNTGVAVDSLGDGVVATAVVPGRVPGSSAVYQKVIGRDGTTTAYLKTTFDPKGNVAHIKDKLSRQMPAECAMTNIFLQSRDELERALNASSEHVSALSLDTVELMLRKFLLEEIDSIYLSDWAELLDGNDRVDFKVGEESLLSTLLFELSSPEINAKIDKELAVSMIERIAHHRYSKPASD